MLDDIINFPNQFLFDAKPFLSSLQIKPSSVVVCGLGGSSLPFDLINDYCFGQLNLHMVRDYNVPAWVTKNDLVICSSYSGNTEETISCFYEALSRNIPVVVMTNGGLLKDLAIKNHTPLVLIPKCIQPRCAVGYFFTACLALFEKIGFVTSQKENLEKLKLFLDGRRKYHEDQGQKIAVLFKEKIPLFYAPSNLKSVARIWKIKINENAKVQSFYNIFPELNHNEMVGFTKLLMSPVIVCLKSKFMHSRIGRRIEVMQEMLGNQISFVPIDLEGENLLQEMFEAHAMADYSSYYLAKLYGVDPAPVKLVEDFKKRLG